MADKKRFPTSKRYSREFKERAVRMVRQLRAETGQGHGTIQRVAGQLDCGVESLRSWVKQDEIDRGEAVGTTTTDAEQIKQLEQEVQELRRANAILKSPSAFFAAELDLCVPETRSGVRRASSMLTSARVVGKRARRS